MNNMKNNLKNINEELECILISTQLTIDSLMSTERSEKYSIEIAKLMFREVEDSVLNLKQLFATGGK
jgi:hypothetical protein